MRNRIASVVVVAALALAGSASAEGMKIEPGKWEFERTARTPMSPEPKVETTTSCVAESEMTPQSFMKDARGCAVSDAETSSETMKWNVTCAAPHGKMTGQARFSSTGKSMKGQMEMTMKMGGQSMKFAQSWKGKRVGDCD